MTVYVDDMLLPARVGGVSGRWSHLMADSRDELLTFAVDRLLMERSWLQDKRTGVHFDVVSWRRERAITLGAVPIVCGSQQWLRVVDQARQQYSGPDKMKRRYPVGW